MGRQSSTITPRLADARAYARASGDRNPIHTDEDAARAAGLPTAILHGMWTMAKLAQAVGAASRCDTNDIERLSVAFRGYVLPDEILTIDVERSEGAGRDQEFSARQGERVVATGVARLFQP